MGRSSNDGTVNWTLAGGSVPGVLAETDGDPQSGFAARDEFITDPSQLGPLLDGEYYTWAPDTWGSENTHNTVVGNPSQVAQFVDDLDFVLSANNSISLYVRCKIPPSSPNFEVKRIPPNTPGGRCFTAAPISL